MQSLIVDWLLNQLKTANFAIVIAEEANRQIGDIVFCSMSPIFFTSALENPIWLISLTNRLQYRAPLMNMADIHDVGAACSNLNSANGIINGTTL